MDIVKRLERALTEFQKLKMERWEEIEEKVQAANRLGVPTEDWIVPPDENKVAGELLKDSDYKRLKSEIVQLIPQVQAFASASGLKTSHILHWVNFTNPLIGNDALGDAIRLLHNLE